MSQRVDGIEQHDDAEGREKNPAFDAERRASSHCSEPANRWRISGSREIARFDGDVEPGFFGESRRQSAARRRPSGGDRPVQPMPIGELRFAFGEIARQQEVEQIGDLREKGLERRVIFDECADGRILTRLRRERSPRSSDCARKRTSKSRSRSVGSPNLKPNETNVTRQLAPDDRREMPRRFVL